MIIIISGSQVSKWTGIMRMNRFSAEPCYFVDVVTIRNVVEAREDGVESLHRLERVERRVFFDVRQLHE